MDTAPSWLRYPLDIKLAHPPLLEAWLEIRWQLQHARSGLLVDPGYPYALGIFYSSIKDRFPVRENVFPIEAPEELLPPYSVRHRFRVAEGEWPLLQLGPGVAAMNLSEPYTWDLFREDARYLRVKLLTSYVDQELRLQSIALRYRNGTPFECGRDDPLRFLREQLNTSVTLPQSIPGPASPSWPQQLSMSYSFALTHPKGTGILRYTAGTITRVDPGTREHIEESMLSWQTEVLSGSQGVPLLSDEDAFLEWLEQAHHVTHDWFFSLIDGALRSQFERE
jgi:uncharacterized protein (TIGR04255 family)